MRAIVLLTALLYAITAHSGPRSFEQQNVPDSTSGSGGGSAGRAVSGAPTRPPNIFVVPADPPRPPVLDRFLSSNARSDWGLLLRFLVVGALVVAAKLLFDRRQRFPIANKPTRATPIPTGPAPRPFSPAAAADPPAGGITRVAFAELSAVAAPDVVAGILTEVFAESAAALVLFRHGTFVVVDTLPEDAVEQAIAIIAAHGPVMPGGPLGDFGTWQIPRDQGVLVTGAHPRMFTFVSPKQLSDPPPAMLAIGLFGRTMRQRDSEEQEIVHVATFPPRAR